MKRLTKRRLAILLLPLILVYSAGYVICRVNKTIVHYTATVGGGECSYHGIDSGDYKIYSVAPALAFFYTPLRYAEVACWKIARPLGGKC